MCKKSQFSLILAMGLTTFLSVCFGQSTVGTPVVGFEKIDLPANSYTSVGINLNNANVISAVVAMVSTNSVTLNSVSNAGSNLTPGELYYLEVASGARAGARLDVDVTATIAAAGSSITILTSSPNNTDTIASLASDLPSALIQVKKHITLADLATRITGLTAGPSGTGDEILLLDASSGGFRTYLRRTSSSWRDVNNNTVNSVPIPPGTGFIVSKKAVAGSITTIGTIRNNSFYLNTVPGYQLVTFGFPINNSPASIGAVGTGSTSPAAGWNYGQATVADSIFRINASGGFDQFFLRTGNSWRDINNTTVNTAEIMPSGGAYVVFKNESLNLELPKPSGL